jgi:anti-sigma-K factor RskA
MKIRSELKGAYEQTPPVAVSEQIKQVAAREMAARASLQNNFRSWFWKPAFALGATAALGIAVIFSQKGSEGPAARSESQLSLEMLREAELLGQLKLLRHEEIWQKMEKRKWQKKKS